jgi:hypothetical protein
MPDVTMRGERRDKILLTSPHFGANQHVGSEAQGALQSAGGSAPTVDAGVQIRSNDAHPFDLTLFGLSSV